MPDVVLITRYVAQYRVPFHEAVRTELATSGIRYRLLYGAPRPGEAARQDSAAIRWAEEISCTYLGPGGKLVWLSVVGKVRGADLVVIAQENALLNNYALQFWRKFGGPRLAYFGHGKNFQIREARQRGGTLQAALDQAGRLVVRLHPAVRRHRRRCRLSPRSDHRVQQRHRHLRGSPQKSRRSIRRRRLRSGNRWSAARRISASTSAGSIPKSGSASCSTRLAWCVKPFPISTC